jgi:hypothetical protein
MHELLIEEIAPREWHWDRSANMLQWKAHASEHPVKFYGLFNDTDALAGYFATRARFQDVPLGGVYKDFHLLSLMDFALKEPSQEHYDALLRALLVIFHSGDHEVLEVITNQEYLAAAARRALMMRVGKGMSFTFHSMGHSKLTTNSPWQLTCFAGDGYSF